jgi:hypothetical protein
MADGRDPSTGFSFRNSLPWTELFRCFQLALDPRKLLVAAVGILAMSVGWYVLSALFYADPPNPGADEYRVDTLKREFKDRKKSDGTDYTEADFEQMSRTRYETDVAQWRVRAELAGPGGQLRTPPWYENRGPNPYLFLTQLTSMPSGTWGVAIRDYVIGQIPVLTEPLVKLLLPVVKLVSPGVSPTTRFYLLLCILWMLTVWGFCGGVITRLAAVQLANKGPITLRQAVKFVADRYTSYLLAPIVPLVIIGVVALGLIIYGILGMIPLVGDLVVYGVGLPLVIAAGAVMAVFLVGLIGYPLMYTTLSVEGDASDTFDALSRSINYVYQAPWHYIWYSLVAVVYGAAVTFFVLFFTSLMLYLGKWAVSQAPWNESLDRKPDYLFIYAPESFGWRELLLKDSPYAIQETKVPQSVVIRGPGPEADTAQRLPKPFKAGEPAPAGPTRQVSVYVPVNPTLFEENRKAFWAYNTWGAGLVCFWLTLLFLMMVGFSYSFFWSAATVIYLLMRKKVDEAELDEVFVEEEEPEAPLAPPKPTDAASPAAGSTSLPVIQSPPAAMGNTPPAVPPPATIPFPPPPEPPKTDGGKPT